MAVKEQNNKFVAWQKIVGLPIFSMASLNFHESRENFGRWKNSFALEMASCWQIFLLRQTNKILLSANRALALNYYPSNRVALFC